MTAYRDHYRCDQCRLKDQEVARLLAENAAYRQQRSESKFAMYEGIIAIRDRRHVLVVDRLGDHASNMRPPRKSFWATESHLSMKGILGELGTGKKARVTIELIGEDE